eukprot:c4807_g1_i1.p1 GENE.c4807_g1_i1~~c4807_g1_i1.p1  ORF type:complete len:538 (-),score=92.59 c4807_g1_i1:148-1761(-)
MASKSRISPATVPAKFANLKRESTPPPDNEPARRASVQGLQRTSDEVGSLRTVPGKPVAVQHVVRRLATPITVTRPSKDAATAPSSPPSTSEISSDYVPPLPEKSKNRVRFGQRELIPSRPNTQGEEIQFDQGERIKPHNIIFENATDAPIGLLVHLKPINNEHWQTEGWFKLLPGEKGLTGTAEQSVFYYYAEVLSDGEGLDRTPRWKRFGWWGNEDLQHHFSDVVSGFRRYLVPADCSNLVVPLRLEDAEPFLNSLSDSDTDSETGEPSGLRTMSADLKWGDEADMSPLAERRSKHFHNAQDSSKSMPSSARPPPPPEIPHSETIGGTVFRMPSFSSSTTNDDALRERVLQGQEMQSVIEMKLTETVSRIIDLRHHSAAAVQDINHFFDAQQQLLEERRQRLLEEVFSANASKTSALSQSLLRLQSARTNLVAAVAFAGEALDRVDPANKTLLQKTATEQLDAQLVAFGGKDSLAQDDVDITLEFGFDESDTTRLIDSLGHVSVSSLKAQPSPHQSHTQQPLQMPTKSGASKIRR